MISKIVKLKSKIGYPEVSYILIPCPSINQKQNYDVGSMFEAVGVGMSMRCLGCWCVDTESETRRKVIETRSMTDPQTRGKEERVAS